LSFQRRFAFSKRKKRGEYFRCDSKNHRVAVCPESDKRSLFQLRQFHASYIHCSDSPDSAKFISPPSSPPNPTNENKSGLNRIQAFKKKRRVRTAAIVRLSAAAAKEIFIQEETN
jgi:hypothetical protein